MTIKKKKGHRVLPNNSKNRSYQLYEDYEQP